MSSPVIIAPTLVTKIERSIPEARLSDPEWIEAEFAAIMAASGLRRRVMVAPASSGYDEVVTRPHPAVRTVAVRHLFDGPRDSRVRSPPSRK